MTLEEFESATRLAFDTAIANSSAPEDCTFKYTTVSRNFGGVNFAQCTVEYESGNEFFNLKQLIEQFESIGENPLIELRGRDTTSQEKTSICAEYKVNEMRFQIIYLLT